MKENFKKIIEEIKRSTLDEEETKKYILAIKKVVRELYDNCEDEEERQELLQDYLKEYEKDLEFRGNTGEIFSKMMMYGSYKRVLSDFKGNKANFDSIVREAKLRESTDNRCALSLKTDLKEAMISTVRYIMRTKNITKERDIIEAVQEEKSRISKDLRNRMINIIGHSVDLLEEYGFIDEYIEIANDDLKKLGLEQLQYEKRNPLPDEQYDEKGNLVEDVEDIGVIDTFSKENLEQLPLEDLEIMTAFWESKYLQERIGLSKAMSTIKTLNLWDEILHEDDEVINNLDEDKINGALKKDLATTYLCKTGIEITPKMQKQYKKFLEEEGLSSDESLIEEVEAQLPDILNLEQAAKDIGILECLIVYQLNTKDLKIKKWGVVENDRIREEEQSANSITIAIENKNFRGPLVIGVPVHILKEFLGTEELNFPKYDKELNETYCDIMSRLYLPTNKFFTNSIKKAYQENPQSTLLADLAGKKVRTIDEK